MKKIAVDIADSDIFSDDEATPSCSDVAVVVCTIIFGEFGAFVVVGTMHVASDVESPGTRWNPSLHCLQLLQFCPAN